MGPLFSNAHLREVAGRVPELKQQALASREDQLASVKTGALAMAYSIAREEGRWVHHLSVSNPITPARAAGTFFLGLLRGLLRLEGYPTEVFVSQSHVFHLVVSLSDDEQEAFAALPVARKRANELRTMAMEGQRAVLPLLEERAVPASGFNAP